MHRQHPQSVQNLIPNDLAVTPLRGHVRLLCNSFLCPCRCFPSRCSTRALCVCAMPRFVLMTETMAIFSCTFKPLLSVLAHIANEVAVTPLHWKARVLCSSADHRSGPSLVLTPQRYMIEARLGFDFHARSRLQSSIHIRDEFEMYASCIPIRDQHKM